MEKRVVMRIELTPTAKESLQKFPDVAGMTQFTVTSRLVEWFALQSETIQSAVIGRYPAEIEADIAKMLLRRHLQAGKVGMD